jgi:hypothetical protein
MVHLVLEWVAYTSIPQYTYPQAFLLRQPQHLVAYGSLWYGPHTDQAKLEFISELRGMRTGRLGPWLVCEDFNLIYEDADKNNHRLN